MVKVVNISLKELEMALKLAQQDVSKVVEAYQFDTRKEEVEDVKVKTLA